MPRYDGSCEGSTARSLQAMCPEQDAESAPIRRPREMTMKAKAPSTTTRLRDAPGEEEDFELCGTGLACRPISTLEVLIWTALQVMGLLFQWSLWGEVGDHLQLYDSTMAANCSPERRRHGICVGPLWNLTAWHETTLVGALQGLEEDGRFGQHPRTSYLRNRHGCHHSYDYVSSLETVEEIDDEIKAVQAEAAAKVAELDAMKLALAGNQAPGQPGLSFSFTFETRSRPPTFLATVEPLARAKKLGETPPTLPPSEENSTIHSERREWPWSLKIERVDPPLQPSVKPFKKQAEGPDVMLVEDLSMEAKQAVQSRGWVRWKATLTSQGSLKQTRYSAYVEDSLASHLEIIEANSQCSFTSAWKAFNEEEQGDNHNLLSWCNFLLAVFMPLSCVIIFFTIWNEQSQEVRCQGLGFHSLVTLKFFAVDIIQQICIVLYLLGWYNADGLRCQLCLFHPSHCEEEHPFRLANTGAFTCTLMSSVAHQILVRPVADNKKFLSDEEWYFAAGLRILAVSVSILPFSTGIFTASSALLAHPLVAQILFFVPCALGWTTVFLLFCLWLRALCRECES
mmetsp:Transcript_69270/g.129348  ORF Transcript_69270/g.129348 Transcript_69270/m.129348 type:complete len:569 (+) Transcript_69270:50-1756(+)